MILSENLIKRYSSILDQCRFIIVQHLLNDTKEFILSLIKNNVEVFHICAKPYSIDNGILNYLQKKHTIPISKLTDDSTLLCTKILNDAIALSKIDKKNIVILDLGGEFSSILSQPQILSISNFKIIIVEDTAFGHRRYENFNCFCENILLYSVAKSRFKELEAKFVGSTIVNTAELLFREIGKTLIGENVLVIGYGLIGKNVALTLRRNNCKVAVYDLLPINQCHAYFDGYIVDSLKKLLKRFPIVFGVTGNTSLSIEDLGTGPSEVFLISGSSKQIEFPMADLKSSYKKVRISQHIDNYCSKGNNIYIFNDGYPVNFLVKSIPDKIIDFMFAEMIECVVSAIIDGADCCQINFANDNRLNEIAKIFNKGEMRL